MLDRQMTASSMAPRIRAALIVYGLAVLGTAMVVLLSIWITGAVQQAIHDREIDAEAMRLQRAYELGILLEPVEATYI